MKHHAAYARTDAEVVRLMALAVAYLLTPVALLVLVALAARVLRRGR